MSEKDSVGHASQTVGVVLVQTSLMYVPTGQAGQAVQAVLAMSGL